LGKQAAIYRESKAAICWKSKQQYENKQGSTLSQLACCLTKQKGFQMSVVRFAQQLSGCSLCQSNKAGQGCGKQQAARRMLYRLMSKEGRVEADANARHM